MFKTKEKEGGKEVKYPLGINLLLTRLEAVLQYEFVGKRGRYKTPEARHQTPDSRLKTEDGLDYGLLFLREWRGRNIEN